MSIPHQPGSKPSKPVSRTAGLSALAFVLSGAMSAAVAQPPGPGGPGGPEGPGAEAGGPGGWGLGIGMVSSLLPYKGVKRKTRAVPMLRFENEYVEVGGLGVEVKLPGVDLGDAGRLKFGLVGQFDLRGYEASDSPFLAGMAERKGSFWAGGRVVWDNDVAELSAQWTADASGNSKGQRFTLGLEKNFRFGDKLMVAPNISAHWLDKKYVDYYYGVRAGEATATRAAYAGKSGVDVEIGLRTMYMFDRHHTVMLDVAATRLASSIKDSTLVDRSSTNRVILGYMYSF